MRPWLSIFAALCGLLLAAPAAPQEKKTPPYTEQKADLGFTLTSGNARAETFSAVYDYKHAFTTGELTFNASAIRSETQDRVFTGVDAANQPIFVETENVAAEAYGVGTKYRRDLGPRLFAYGLGAWARILQAGLDDRWRGGGGFGWKLLQPQPHTLDFELGAEYTDETYVDGSGASFASLRAFTDYEYAISEHSSFSSELEFLENLDDTEDYRFNWNNSVTASLASHLALKVGYLLLFDHRPAVLTLAPGPPPVLDEREELDQVFTTSLVVNW